MLRVFLITTIVVACAAHAHAAIVITVTPTSAGKANLVVTGSTTSTTGTLDAIGSLRPSIVTLLSPFAATGATSGPPYSFASTDLSVNGTVQCCNTTTSASGFWSSFGGEQKLSIGLLVNPAVGSVLSGSIQQLDIPAGYTFKAAGSTGTLRNGSNNSGTSQVTIGSWVIGSANVISNVAGGGLLDVGSVDEGGAAIQSALGLLTLENTGTVGSAVGLQGFTFGDPKFSLAAGNQNALLVSDGVSGGSDAAQFQFGFDPTGLAPGTYTTSLTVNTDTGPLSYTLSAQVVAQNVPEPASAAVWVTLGAVCWIARRRRQVAR